MARFASAKSIVHESVFELCSDLCSNRILLRNSCEIAGNNSILHDQLLDILTLCQAWVGDPDPFQSQERASLKLRLGCVQNSAAFCGILQDVHKACNEFVTVW